MKREVLKVKIVIPFMVLRVVASRGVTSGGAGPSFLEQNFREGDSPVHCPARFTSTHGALLLSRVHWDLSAKCVIGFT